MNAHTDARTRFVIADRPQTIVWAFTLSSRTSIWRFMAIWPSVESLFSITPLPDALVQLHLDPAVALDGG